MKDKGTVVNGIMIFIAVLAICSCTGKRNAANSRSVLPTGQARLAVPGGEIWYRVSGHGTGIPVVLIHGGPGMSSFYLKPFEELGNDRQVIRYDQLGGGKSDRITDTAMFTVDHFVNELELLRRHLGVEKWHIIGHSFGTILATEYYRKYPGHVASLSLAGAALSVPKWAENVKKLLTTLPVPMQEAISKAEMTGNYTDTLYQQAMGTFYGMYAFHKLVMADLDSMNATQNLGIYNYMQGPSEFTITGTLKNYDITPFLPEIKVPTLFTVGEYDEAGPEVVKGYAEKVPGAKYVMLAGAAHNTIWDSPEENIRIEREFLKEADSPGNKQASESSN